MNYLSTRNSQIKYSFADATLKGLAPEGGLFVPEMLPDFTGLVTGGFDYRASAEMVFAPFVAPCFDADALKELIEEAYQDFDVDEVVQLKNYGDYRVLELFHGPTLAFKDIALQLLGKILGRLLSGREAVTVIGATSGDTGGAAIAALDGLPQCQVFMLFPKGRVSAVQELQMTAGVASNIFPIAIDGSFDDAQALVKQLFADPEVNQRFNLTTVNSINWCRIMAQMVYYFFAMNKLKSENTSLNSASFVVPTGNFGDVLAGFYAQKCGLPVNRLVVACNENDLLARTYHTGVYQPLNSRLTLSPAMDIQVASNFERLLFELSGRDCDYVAHKMKELKESGKFVLEKEIHGQFQNLFDAYAISDKDTVRKMKEMAEQNILVDPHTAVGLCAAEFYRQSSFADQDALITLSTAHPVKFADTLKENIGYSPEWPDRLLALKELPKRILNCSNHYSELQPLIFNRSLL